MPKNVDVMVEGGKATAAPPIGPALAPLGINVGQVVSKINEKTKDFSGMQVPVKIIVKDDKSFDIKVGTPPTSAMIKKEAKVEKLSGKPNTEKVADMKMEQIIKIAKNKLDDFNTADPISAVKQVIGACVAGGILIEGKDAKEVMKEVASGMYHDKIKTWKTELTKEELAKLEVERKELAKKMEELHKKQRETAEKIMAEMAAAKRFEIVAKMREAGVPNDLINELLPAKKTEEGAPGAAPAAGKAAEPAKK